jgi:hypothetical protein
MAERLCLEELFGLFLGSPENAAHETFLSLFIFVYKTFLISTENKTVLSSLYLLKKGEKQSL